MPSPIPSRNRSKLAGLMAAAAGLMILGSHGPSAGAQVSSGVAAKAPVAGKIGFVTAPASSVDLLNGTAAGAPGDTVSAAVDMVVESNKAYVVTVQAGAAQMTATGTSDTISIGSLKTTVPGGGTAALSDTASVTIASSATKSTPVTGDAVSSTLSLTIPWVEPGTYSVNLNYTVAQSA